MRRLLVTGSSGLIGSEVCTYFGNAGWEIHGIDNNQRAVFFGPSGDNRQNQYRLQRTLQRFTHHEIDIRDRNGIVDLMSFVKPDAVIHTAAQPSHDRATAIPFDDFDTNAVGTFNLLEATRRYDVNTPFVHLSTNKVYGDSPNEIEMAELQTRWDYADDNFKDGIPETFRIDQCKHSLFGVSKIASDMAVQEYGRYFGMPTVCLRGGCLTGPNHSGVELHGFLSYLIKCNLEGKEYTIYGYKGKQVRDNIHSFDVAKFIEEFIHQPKIGEVYNIGGGKQNSCSVLEAFDLISALSGKPMNYTYVEHHRSGDHICYYSNLNKMHRHYPSWRITKSLITIFEEIYEAYSAKYNSKKIYIHQ